MPGNNHLLKCSAHTLCINTKFNGTHKQNSVTSIDNHYQQASMGALRPLLPAQLMLTSEPGSSVCEETEALRGYAAHV